MSNLTPDDRTKLVGRALLCLVAAGIGIYSALDHFWLEVIGVALLLLSQWLSLRRFRQRRSR